MSKNSLNSAFALLEQYDAQREESKTLKSDELAEALRWLSKESLEIFAALAECMMDSEIGPRARELSQRVADESAPKP